MDHLRTSASLTTMALALAISLVPATALAAKGGNGGGPGGGNGGGKGGGNLTAVDDSGSVAYDGSLTLDVLANDSGGAKTVIDVTQGTLGAVAISDARNVSYTPDATQTVTFPFTDTFTYTMTNKKQSSQSIGTVTVIVSGPPDDPDVRLVPLSSWGETEVRHVLATFAYGGLATDAQIATWAGMVPASAINEILTFGVNNDQLSPIVDANATYCGSMLELQQFWSSDDPANIMRFDDRFRYAELSTNTNLSTSNLQRTWVKAINTRGCNPFLHKMGLYLTTTTPPSAPIRCAPA